jgi:hypothetical protein
MTASVDPVYFASPYLLRCGAGGCRIGIRTEHEWGVIGDSVPRSGEVPGSPERRTSHDFPRTV